MTADEERLQRYLEWRRAGRRERAARRRRALGYVVAPALCVVAVGLAAWLGRPSRDPGSAVGAVTRALPPELEVTARELGRDTRESAIGSPEPAAPVQAPPAPAAERAAPAAPATVRVAPRPHVSPVPRSSPAVAKAHVVAPAPPADPVTTGSDAAAAVAPAPDARVSAPPTTVPESRVEPTREVVSETVPATLPPGGAVAVAPPTVRERMTTWAKGEVQEFRDGVKREIGEFRSGYEKVRDFFRPRDARSPAR